jgi:hypothetical protein
VQNIARFRPHSGVIPRAVNPPKIRKIETMAVCLSVARIALGCAALALAAAATPAEARGRHHIRHHHRQVEIVAAPAPQEAAWGSSDWGRASWTGEAWNSTPATQQAKMQSWGDPAGTWGGSAGWSQQARAERSEATGRAGGGLKALVARHAAENGVPFALADAVVKIESGYNPGARNRSGAMGLMQIKTQTARGQGFGGSSAGLLNPDTNLRFAMRYLATAYRMSGGDVCGTVMRYQSGHYAHRMSGADRSYCSKARRLMAHA